MVPAAVPSGRVAPLLGLPGSGAAAARVQRSSVPPAWPSVHRQCIEPRLRRRRGPPCVRRASAAGVGAAGTDAWSHNGSAAGDGNRRPAGLLQWWSEWWAVAHGRDDPDEAPPEKLLQVAGRLVALVTAEDARMLGWAALFMVSAALAELGIPHFVSKAIVHAAAAEPAQFAATMRALAALTVSYGALSAVRGYLFSVSNQRLVRRLQDRVFSALVRQPISYFDAHDVGELTSRLNSDCTAVGRALCTNLNVAARNALQCVIGGAYLAHLSLPIAGAALAVTLLLWAATLRYGRFSRRAARTYQDCTAAANRVSTEAFSLARTVRAFGTEAQESAKYAARLSDLFEIARRQNVAYGLYLSASNTFFNGAKVAAILTGAAIGGASGELLTTCVLYLDLVLASSLSVADQWPPLCEALGSSERVLAMAALPPAPQLDAGETPAAERARGHVSLRGVSYGYAGRDTPVLRDVNMDIAPGTVVALVGLSGCGKSTLAALVQRLYDPTSGVITLDGVPLQALDAAWLRARMGVVSQEPRLFGDTVAENIACGAAVSRSQVEAAARAANADEFIRALPLGYDTPVSSAGLSGGQKQRVAIARALVRDPLVLLLDEATSALDQESESLVTAALDAAMRGAAKRSVLIIAHRLSTVRNADVIAVMDGGAIVERGTHDELAARPGGLYRALLQRQAGTLGAALDGEAAAAAATASATTGGEAAEAAPGEGADRSHHGQLLANGEDAGAAAVATVPPG